MRAEPPRDAPVPFGGTCPGAMRPYGVEARASGRYGRGRAQPGSPIMAEMTSRERYQRMFQHREADRVPIIDIP